MSAGSDEPRGVQELRPEPLPAGPRHPWHVGDLWLDEPGATVMGVLNLTPDSFFDGGRYATHAAAVARAEELFDEGARIIDIGGESSRPGAEPVPLGEELRRTIPVIESVMSRLGPCGLIVSIDTTKAEVARRAVLAGARIVNDISALQADPLMAETVAELSRSHGAAVVLNHMQGTPDTMQREPLYQDVLEEVKLALLAQAQKLEALGMESARICLDPGIGFGKLPAHNHRLIWNAAFLCATGYPVLLGMSRKRFIAGTPGLEQSDRLAPSLAAAVVAELAGARVVRVHDVQATREALLLVQGLRMGAR